MYIYMSARSLFSRNETLQNIHLCVINHKFSCFPFVLLPVFSQYSINPLLYHIVCTGDMWPLDMLGYEVSGTDCGEYYVIIVLWACNVISHIRNI
jgi:hypothetical protein